MRLIETTRDLGTELSDREIGEVVEHADDIKRLIEGRNLYEAGDALYVAQGHGGQVFAWPLVDWYLECDTDAKEMTDADLAELEGLGGVVRW